MVCDSRRDDNSNPRPCHLGPAQFHVGNPGGSTRFIDIGYIIPWRCHIPLVVSAAESREMARYRRPLVGERIPEHEKHKVDIKNLAYRTGKQAHLPIYILWLRRSDLKL